MISGSWLAGDSRFRANLANFPVYSLLNREILPEMGKTRTRSGAHTTTPAGANRGSLGPLRIPSRIQWHVRYRPRIRWLRDAEFRPFGEIPRECLSGPFFVANVFDGIAGIAQSPTRNESSVFRLLRDGA